MFSGISFYSLFLYLYGICIHNGHVSTSDNFLKDTFICLKGRKIGAARREGGRKEERQRIFHPWVPQMATIAGSRPGQSQKPETFQVSQMGGRNSDT